jgi:hypothetical protein
MTLEGCKLRYHSGKIVGEVRGSYFTVEETSLEVGLVRKQFGERGTIGPFLRVGDFHFTKEQAMKLSQAIAEEAAKMETSE